MTDKLEQLEVRGKRLSDLRDKLKARQGKLGYEKNCEALIAEITKFESHSS